MKRLMIMLLLACLLLYGCAQQQESASVTVMQDQLEVPSEEPLAPPPVVEVPAIEPEIPSLPNEQPAPAAEAEQPKEEPAQSNLYTIKRGDKLTVSGHSLEVYELLNVGTLITFKIDGAKYFKVSNTRSPEIAEKLEFEIVENNFNRNSSVVVSIKPLALNEGEYILYKGEYATVNSTKIYLDGVKKSDKDEFAWAYISVPSVASSQFTVHEGATVSAGRFDIALLRAFDKYSEYAVLRITER